MESAFSRLQRLIGADALARLKQTRVILFGVGGVGSWAAEALVRNGIGHVTLVDSDAICVTNLNRQLQATQHTIGQSKVHVLGDRLRDIHGHTTIEPIHDTFSPHNAHMFNLDSFNYVIDAIDSLTCKVELIARALDHEIPLFSAMGAARKLDPNAIRTGSFWRITGCPLAKCVRKRLRNRHIHTDFIAVYSSEASIPYLDRNTSYDTCNRERIVNGSAVHITGMFGLHLAALVTNHVITRPHSSTTEHAP